MIVPGLSIVPQGGGQGTVCAQWASGMIQLGHEVRVATSDAADWRAWAERNSLGSALAIVPAGPRALAAGDVIHLNSCGLRDLVMAAMARRPLVVTHIDYLGACPTANVWSPRGPCLLQPGETGPCRNCEGQGGAHRARMLLRKWLLRRARSVALSESIGRWLGLKECILGSFDGSGLADLSGGRVERKITFVGRLVEEKGVQVVLRALSLLPGVRLDIYGRGPYRRELEEEARRRGVSERVTFQPRTPESPIFTAASSASIIVPSLWQEGFGYVTVEAMALGKAVVAAATGASVELLAEGRGWLVPPDSPEPLAEAVEEVLSRPSERRKRGRMARAFVHRALDPRTIAQAYERVYRGHLDGARG